MCEHVCTHMSRERLERKMVDITIMQPSNSIFKSIINVKWEKSPNQTPSKPMRVKEGTDPNSQILYLSDFP